MSQNPQDPADGQGTKLIINGGSAGRRLELAAGLLAETCEGITSFIGNGGKFPNIKELIRMANDLEDDAAAWDKRVTEFQKAVLKQAGYGGPFPKCMG